MNEPSKTEPSITALVSAYARAYHHEHNQVTVFADTLAKRMLQQEEYAGIGQAMAQGISFFNPSFTGTEAEALRWIVDHQLSPTTLGRAAFCERSLEAAVRVGARQYVILGAGYDTFAYRQPPWAQGLRIFELDHPATAEEKSRRLTAAALEPPDNLQRIAVDFNDQSWPLKLSECRAFDQLAVTFCSLLGVSYYLPETSLTAMLQALGGLLPPGSAVVFDYPDELSYTDHAGERSRKQIQLAQEANEAMLPGYSYPQMEALLAECGFLIYEHLTPEEITRHYFADYNRANPLHPMSAMDNVNYGLAVRRTM